MADYSQSDIQNLYNKGMAAIDRLPTQDARYRRTRQLESWKKGWDTHFSKVQPQVLPTGAVVTGGSIQTPTGTQTYKIPTAEETKFKTEVDRRKSYIDGANQILEQYTIPTFKEAYKDVDGTQQLQVTRDGNRKLDVADVRQGRYVPEMKMFYAPGQKDPIYMDPVAYNRAYEYATIGAGGVPGVAPEIPRLNNLEGKSNLGGVNIESIGLTNPGSGLALEESTYQEPSLMQRVGRYAPAVLQSMGFPPLGSPTILTSTAPTPTPVASPTPVQEAAKVLSSDIVSQVYQEVGRDRDKARKRLVELGYTVD